MKLSLSERFVLERLVDGEHLKEIAHQRQITLSGVSQITKRVRARLGARTTYQAVAMYAVDKAKK